jgi:hypothetical protein
MAQEKKAEKKANGPELQVTGFMTLSGSAKLPNAEELLAAPEGKVKCFRKVLVDPVTGEEVVIKGKMFLSAKGNITSRIAFVLNSPEVILQDEKASKAEPKEDLLAAMGALLKA